MRITQGETWTSTSGLAIGPILFIIAVLGLLAAANAAGSGSFSSTTTSESDSARAGSLIDLGQSMKSGFDRILGEQGVSLNAVDTNVLNTNSVTALFSPVGGGLGPPPITMSYQVGGVASGVWLFPMIVVPRLGSSLGSRVAMIRVDPGVCDQINKKANAYQGTPSLAATSSGGDFGALSAQTTALMPTSAEWSAGGVLDRYSTGCLYTNTPITGTGAGYYFYQVLEFD